MTMSEKLRRAMNKVKKANHGTMRELSTGEKVIKVVLILIKISVVAFILMLFGVVILAIAAAVGIMNAIIGGVNDQINRSWNYHHRPRNW